MSDLVKHYRQLVGIAASWAGAHLPEWADEMHRDLLSRHGASLIKGRVSASSLNLAQLGAVLDDYERRGWTRQRQFKAKGQAPAKKVPPQVAHLVRLWGKLGQAGKVQNASRPALLAFCARQTGRAVPDLDSLEAPESSLIIEALKGWLAR
jgi:hypothetical protein